MRNFLMLRRPSSADWKVIDSFGLVHVSVNKRGPCRLFVRTFPDDEVDEQTSESVRTQLEKVY